MTDNRTQLLIRAALFVAIALWAYTEHEARAACHGNERCLAASL